MTIYGDYPSSSVTVERIILYCVGEEGSRGATLESSTVEYGTVGGELPSYWEGSQAGETKKYSPHHWENQLVGEIPAKFTPSLPTKGRPFVSPWIFTRKGHPCVSSPWTRNTHCTGCKGLSFSLGLPDQFEKAEDMMTLLSLWVVQLTPVVLNKGLYEWGSLGKG